MAQILVLEMDSEVRRTLIGHLRAAGHSVAPVHEPMAALAAVRSGAVDLVVAGEPQVRREGLDFLQRLAMSATGRPVPLVVVCAFAGAAAFRSAMNLGVDDFFTWPVRPEPFLRAVAFRLAQAAARAASPQPDAATDLERTRPMLAAAGSLRAICPGTALFLVVRNARMLAEGLSAGERREAARMIRTAMAEPIAAQRGVLVAGSAWHSLAFFPAAALGRAHAAGALRAAAAAAFGTAGLRARLRGLLGRSLGDALAIAAVLESGEALFEQEAGGATLRGPLVDELMQVDPMLEPSGWAVAIGTAAAREARGLFRDGRAASFLIPGTEVPQTFLEVTDLPGSGGADAPGRTETLALPAAPGPLGEGVAAYAALEHLGHGGMAQVYLARHRASGERHVLKMLPIEANEDALQRFLQEYALIAQVGHPHVVRIHGQGFGTRCAYIAMEHLPGGTLRDRLRSGIASEDALRFVQQVALALEAIHARGIIHCDLKPENLMFRDDGTLVLTDFGIAMQPGTELTPSAPGEVYGTPYYMSPEQARGAPLDARSDLYALGIIAFEMLAGVKPFSAARADAVVRQHLHAPVPRLPEALSDLQPLLERLLAKSPADRYASAGALLRALRGTPRRPRPAAQPAPALAVPA